VPDVPPPEPTIDDAIENQQPAFYVHAELDRQRATYREGEALRLNVRSERDAYVYVLYQQADGKIYQIYPNSVQPDNRVAAGQTVEIPCHDDLFRWIIGPPFGKEVVKVIASEKPMDDLSNVKMRSARFNRVPAKMLARTAAALKNEAVQDWAEVDLELVTVAQDAPPGYEGSRRWGVFFGVSEYRYNDIVKEDSEGKESINLRGCHRDAQQLAEVMAKAGHLDGHRVYVNQEATRANLESAITEWLPSVSKPGDTVFITFSGHGGQIPDDNGDEREDHLDEIICPYDFMHAGIFVSLLKRLKEGRISAEDKQRIEQLLPYVQRAANDEKAAELIMRQTCVSDDLFGRWLQKLAGRQVIVILDTCHSGGFAAQEKGIEPATLAREFDFLDSEAARLKDIGQREEAVLAAAKAAQVAFETPNGQNGLMSYFLLEGLKQAKGPLRLEDAFAYCQSGMAEFFKVVNQRRREQSEEPLKPHQPHLKNYCSQPALLIP